MRLASSALGSTLFVVTVVAFIKCSRWKKKKNFSALCVESTSMLTRRYIEARQSDAERYEVFDFVFKSKTIMGYYEYKRSIM